MNEWECRLQVLLQFDARHLLSQFLKRYIFWTNYRTDFCLLLSRPDACGYWLGIEFSFEVWEESELSEKNGLTKVLRNDRYGKYLLGGMSVN